MGHVDHGKTSILDYIRKTHVADKESGGITQHIGASVADFQGKKITFIDTPGHEAFSQMRQRGAKIADIAILVVAAEEGLKPQTKEAINAIKKSGIPMIVALNKIDLPSANVDKSKRELQKEDILVEDWGGNTPAIPVSAKTGKGIDDLLEMILLVAEMENLASDPDAPASGIIIESSLDHRRGPSASILLQDGILVPGKILTTESSFGRIKTLEDTRGQKIDKLLPSQPAIAIGFDMVPVVGETFREIESLEAARDYVVNLQRQVKKNLAATQKNAPELKEGQKNVNIVLKADVLGSLEVLRETINQIPQTDVFANILEANAGEISLNDIKTARAGGNAVIIGFRVKTNPDAKAMAEREKIRIMNFDILYEMIEWIRNYMEKARIPKYERKELGKLRVLLSFWAEKSRQIVGGKIVEGTVKRGVKIEVLRHDSLVGQGRLINLQKNKKDIDEADKGEEVGILYEGAEKIQEGDYLVFYTQERNV
jgi:translation initiation factor IF-2